jgi:hypothetical protein
MINKLAKLTIRRLSENSFSPKILNMESSNFRLSSEVIALLEIGQSLILDGIVLKETQNSTKILTNIGLLETDKENIDYSDEESDSIRIE